MPYKAVTLHYGEFPGICQLHYGDAYKFGTLIDPQGHSWLVCADCISALWDVKQAIKVQLEQEEIAVEVVMDKLRRLLTDD